MALLDLVLPLRCAGCGLTDGLACRVCLEPLTRPPRPSVPRPCPAGLPPTWTIADYDGSVRELLIGYKERGLIGLRAPLSAALAVAIGAALGSQAGPTVVVSMPSSSAAVRERGDDVVGDLVGQAVRRLRRARHRVRLVRALRQRPGVADSAGLDAAARAANLDHALAVRPAVVRRLGGARVVLADDLMTTGATLTEAARALRATGAEVVGAATVAATARRLGL